MNAIMFAGSDAALRMTSQEIADLVEKRHDNVKRTIESLSEQGVIARPQIEDVQEIGGNNRIYTTQQYVFTSERGKRDSIVVVAQLSPEFTARLVDRWQELEARESALPLPNFANPAEAARAWAEQFERRTALEQQTKLLEQQKTELDAKVAGQAPKVETLQRIADAEGSLCIRDAASNLQMQPSKLTTWLHANGWIYRRLGKSGWLAYHDKQQAGYLVHKSTPYVDRATGDERVREQVRITMRGLTRLGELVSRDQGRMQRASGYANRKHRAVPLIADRRLS